MGRYSDEQRRNAVALVGEHGIAEAHRKTGIPKTTLSGWATDAGVARTGSEKTRAALEASNARCEEIRGEIRVKLASRASELLDRINEAHVEFVGKDGRREEIDKATAQATQHYAVSVGILIDKLRLELGEVTDRTEHVSQSEFDREVSELVEKVRSTVPATNGNGNGH